MDIDILSIVLLECFGIVSFLLAFVFFRQSRKINDKQESLKKATVDEIWDGPCYSYKWVMSHTLTPRKVLKASPFLAVVSFLISWFIWFYVAPWLISVPGYHLLIALIGVAMLFQTDAFEALSYGRAVQKAPLGRLKKWDQDYMELAKEALEKAVIRFLMIGIVFAIAGPFIPQIFDGLIYALVTYTGIVLQATKSISIVLAFIVGAIFITILLYLPELMGRTIFQRVKLLAQKIWEHWRKR